MLNEDKLYKNILELLNNTLPTAFEYALLATFPGMSETGSDIAKKFGESIDTAISDAIAKGLASAIDCYVKNADIYGTVITVGSPTTQTAKIESPSVLTNGKVPNTLGLK
jgi:hypothetical protein